MVVLVNAECEWDGNAVTLLCMTHCLDHCPWIISVQAQVMRDQAEAHRWFRAAADAGSPEGRAACGDLLVKGEGVGKNVTAAIADYKIAAADNSVRALNGLGFVHYSGDPEWGV